MKLTGDFPCYRPISLTEVNLSIKFGMKNKVNGARRLREMASFGTHCFQRQRSHSKIPGQNDLTRYILEKQQ